MPTDYIDPEAMVADGEIVNNTPSSDYARVWDTLQEARDAGTNVRGLVTDAGRGGLTVDLGVRGFIPKSEIATRNLNNLDRFIGQTVEVKVLEADRETGRVVLSERKVADEQRVQQRIETMASLEKGQVLEGVVRRITDFGAFVDIGGVDGLLHVSDLAWEQVKHPSDVVSVGQTLQVMVLKIEREGERISLGLKQLQEDPWTALRNEAREGHVLEVEVLRVESAGLVVQVMQGVEGFIPRREITDRHAGGDETQAFEAGQKVQAKILEIRFRERSVTLSIRQAVRDRERGDIREHMRRQRDDDAPVTLGDLFGDVFNKLQKRE